ncbi:MAG: tetratricopeptide repeat protein [Treponema sp.]|nr:tetratricopeptide repeat protein [Treponema sp.]
MNPSPEDTRILPAPEAGSGLEDEVTDALPAETAEAPPGENVEVLLPPGLFRVEEAEDPLPEPVIDFADTLVEPLPPREEALEFALPEPLAPLYVPEPPVEAAAEPPAVPVQPPEVPPPVIAAPAASDPVVPAPAPGLVPGPAAPEPAVEPAVPGTAAEPEIPEAAAEPEIPVPAVSPPTVALPPETAPSFIRPAEEETPPAAREPAPLPALPESPAYAPPEIGEPGMNFSRVVRAAVGQLVEVPFRGTGWVYLGELSSRPGIVYNSRRLDPEGQSFVFRVEAAGTYGLKFYKQDFIQDYILNDYVQVIVRELPEAAAVGWFNPAHDQDRVVAEPRWPSALEEAEITGQVSGAGPKNRPAAQVAEKPAEAVGVGPLVSGEPGTGAQPGPAARDEAAARDESTAQTGARESAAAPEPARPEMSGEGAAPGGAVSAAPRDTAELRDQAVPGAADARPETPLSENLTPGGYLDSARREYDAGRVAAALSILDQFRERYPSGSDEAWWLYGQFYEAGGPSRDIRTALDYYRRLIREYPQSRRCDEARRRIAYLERYYINIK